MVFAVILGRFLGIYHPMVKDSAPLDTPRKIVGWFCLAIFVLCFTPIVLKVQ
jgi:hypothetical protein